MRGAQLPRTSLRTRITLSTLAILVVVLGGVYWVARAIVVRAVRDLETAVSVAEVELRRAVVVDRVTIAQSAAAIAARGVSEGTLHEALADHQGESVVEWLLLAEQRDGEWSMRAWTRAGAEIEPGALGLQPYLCANSPLLRPQSLHGVRAGLITAANRLTWVGVAPLDSADGERVLLIGVPFEGAAGYARFKEAAETVRLSLQVRAVTPQRRLDEPGRMARLATPLGESVAFETGSDWHVGTSPYRLMVALQDLFGTTVGSLAIELSPLYQALGEGLLDRLLVVVPVAGIGLTLLVFLMQAHGVRRPVEGAARELAETARSAMPSVGSVQRRDEFGMLAQRLNDLLRDLTLLRATVHEQHQTRAAMLTLVTDVVCVFRTDGTVAEVLSNATHLPSLQQRLKVGATLGACGLRRASLAEFENALKDTSEGETQERVVLLVPPYRETPALRIEGRLHPLSAGRVLVAFRPIQGGGSDEDAGGEALARQEQQNLQDALVRLVVGIAHDINNLLTVLDASLATHMEQHGPEDSAPELVAIAQASKHAEELVRQLQVYAGIADTRFERVNLAAFLHAKWPLLRASVPHHIELGLDLDNGLPEVLADTTQMLQLVSNLLRNAVEAIDEEPGRIQIRLRELRQGELDLDRCVSPTRLDAARYVELSVSDTGHGIAPGKVSRVLEPFYSTKGEGRGLGLAMVAGILESHSGGIRVNSHLGEGTTFALYLPALSDEPEEAGRATAEEGELARSLGVLLVEDDSRVRHVTRLLLESLDCTVWEARDGRETRLCLRKYGSRIDLVLLDANVRGMDGLATLKRIRQQNPALPVLLTSGDAESRVRRVFRLIRFDGFIAKPFNRDAVAKALDEIRARTRTPEAP